MIRPAFIHRLAENLPHDVRRSLAEKTTAVWPRPPGVVHFHAGIRSASSGEVAR